MNDRQRPLAGRQHQDLIDGKPVGDLAWVRHHSTGNWTINLFCWVLRKVFRRCQDLVTYDHQSFVDAMAAARAELGDEFPLVVVPVHRSYFDFLFCSYLFHAHPELGIKLPKIAAAEEFGQVPILGHLLNRCGAFYIRRGVGKEDIELTDQVHELVAERSVFEFFIEGKRSRAREFLPPKRGMLRCLQGTGDNFAILPIAISYDRRAEERALAIELTGGAKPKMSLPAMGGWALRLLSGRMNLGRIHIRCGDMLSLNPSSDVKALAQALMVQLQQHTATSEFHLRVFAANTGVAADWLAQELRRRGALLIGSDQPADDPYQPVPPVTERSLRNHWQHWFADEARTLAPNNPALNHWLDRQCYVEAQTDCSDPQLPKLLTGLYAPVCKNYIWLAKVLRGQSPSMQLERESLIRETFQRHPQADWTLLHTALDGLVAAGLLTVVADGIGLRRVPTLDSIDDYIAASGWQEAESPKSTHAAETAA